MEPYMELSKLVKLLATDVDEAKPSPGFGGLVGCPISKYCKRTSSLLGVLGDDPKDWLDTWK